MPIVIACWPRDQCRRASTDRETLPALNVRASGRSETTEWRQMADEVTKLKMRFTAPDINVSGVKLCTPQSCRATMHRCQRRRTLLSGFRPRRPPARQLAIKQLCHTTTQRHLSANARLPPTAPPHQPTRQLLIHPPPQRTRHLHPHQRLRLTPTCLISPRPKSPRRITRQ